MILTFYWHDYETWGTDPRYDRPAQFAGLRTDEALHPIAEPLVIYCKPATDMLPHPEACLVTGITPQKATAEGLVEAEFTARIHAELAQPGTCGVGYNSIRFDDEFTRYTLYRNFYDPYAREWRDGNSRWDIIDMVRLTHALRPEGIEWPSGGDGKPSFRLEELTRANGIAHEAAHDALSDVHATIALARLIKQRQPRLYEYVLSHRQKQRIAPLLNLQRKSSVLHVSSMYPAESGCIAMVVPVVKHPSNPNGVLVYDLRHDPTPFLHMDEEDLQRCLFTPAADLPQGMERLPLKTVHLNKCPVVVPLNTLTPQAARRWDIDVERGERYRARLLAAEGLTDKLVRIHRMDRFDPVADPDQALYSGGFFNQDDRRRMDGILQTEPRALADFPLVFDDPRLPEMLFRYRARNWPETLSVEERERWDEYRRVRLFETDGGGSLRMDDYLAILDQLELDPTLPAQQRRLVPELMAWAEQIT